MVAVSSETRCPACGQPLEAFVRRCPLCDFQLAPEGTTGEDLTPYAHGVEHDRPAWGRMLLWIWLAGGGRMKHLALMRGSGAARRFATINLLVFGLAVLLVEWSLVGWHWSYAGSARGAAGSAEPSGEGWFQVASVPRPLGQSASDDAPTGLWWNPAQCLIAAPLAGVLSVFILWLLGQMVLLGVHWAHAGPYRGEQRMTAAILYSSAWLVPLWAAAVVMAVRPLGYVGAVARWGWCPSDNAFVAVAAIVGAFGLAMWWFWLVRLGGSAPADTRGRVVLFFVVVAPLLAAGAVVLWWYGRRQIYGPIFDKLGLRFS